MSNQEYLDAPQEVLDLAQKLVVTHHQADFAKARIKYLMKPAKKSSWAGRCHLAHGPWRYLLPDYDYVILLWQEYFQANEARREPLLYHELCHVARTESGKWALRKHPITEFPEVIMEYGCWAPELACLEPRIRRAY
jgi:predicted metallopeptidase